MDRERLQHIFENPGDATLDEIAKLATYVMNGKNVREAFCKRLDLPRDTHWTTIYTTVFNTTPRKPE